MTDTTTRKKKLIEVALPLDEINAACKADKDRKTGTIRNLHKWFAPMPLPAWRALLFAALVDDPEDDNQRVYLLDLIKRLVANGADLPQPDDLAEASGVLQRQFPHGVPTVMDPFCGGGSTLVEAQRLGLPSYGSDLNPVPALISRTVSELLPTVYGRQPLFPSSGSERPGNPLRQIPLLEDEEPRYEGYDAVLADVAHYARVVLKAVTARTDPLFHKEPGETPVAWLWARTASCPNPACGIETLLATTWWLNKKRGDLAWLVPRVVGGKVELDVVSGQPNGSPMEGPKIGDGVFACVSCGATLDGNYLRAEGQGGRLGLRMTAVVSETSNGRKYRAATASDLASIETLQVEDSPADVPLNVKGQGIRVGLYGMTTWESLFTPRQLLTLTAFAEGIESTFEQVLQDGGDEAWARTVTTILGLALGQLARSNSSQCRWRLRAAAHAKAEGTFGRNDLPMMWDFAETYYAGGSVGDWLQTAASVASAATYAPRGSGRVDRADARVARTEGPVLIATDPPYFDAIGYADLSDYFYVWHRRALRSVHPDLYVTVASPKAGELTAIASHHDDSNTAAREYFISGFTEAFHNLSMVQSPELPMIVVYASKEQKGGASEETRWSSILTAMVQAGIEITGAWPVHGTGSTRMVGQGTNSVASYIAMVCRPRSPDASTTTLADLNRALRRELGPAVRDLQAASILPVDLAQAAMGPGMQIYSRYRAVLDQSGNPVEVGQALRMINAALAEVLEEQEGELDRESRFAVRWWETHGWVAAPFGEADKAVRPLGIGVDDVVRAQIVTSYGNRVQLVGVTQLDRGWTPEGDSLPTAWEAVHHLADRLIDGGGELEAAKLMARLGSLQDPAMALTYRLHDIAAKKGRTADQERYNALINSWAELVRLSGDSAATTEGLF